MKRHDRFPLMPSPVRRPNPMGPTERVIYGRCCQLLAVGVGRARAPRSPGPSARGRPAGHRRAPGPAVLPAKQDVPGQLAPDRQAPCSLSLSPWFRGSAEALESRCPAVRPHSARPPGLGGRAQAPGSWNLILIRDTNTYTHIPSVLGKIWAAQGGVWWEGQEGCGRGGR